VTGGATAILAALVAAYGVFLLYTATVLGWHGFRVATGLGRGRRHRNLEDLLIQSGLDGVRLPELIGVEAVLLTVGAAGGYTIYGGLPAALVAGVCAATAPIAAARSRRRARQERARDSWPRMIEEIRMQAVSLGRSVPQALLGVGLRGPDELRPAFAAAQREWSMSTEFERTLDVLKQQLADPTADAVCETLLIAHEVGGTDLDQRLRGLIDDRIEDQQGRKDARSKQAGVRFARWFVLFVPLGMAVVGIGIGDGRAAYGTPIGQTLVLAAFAMIGACWIWAGQLLKLPVERRVFHGRPSGTGR
jgi:tight adherence protein B